MRWIGLVRCFSPRFALLLTARYAGRFGSSGYELIDLQGVGLPQFWLVMAFTD